MSEIAMLAQVFEVLVRLTRKYAAREIDHQEFLRAWTAMGTGVALVAKGMTEKISLGRMAASRGGQRGGPARAASLSSEQRSEQARHAANERWLGDGRDNALGQREGLDGTTRALHHRAETRTAIVRQSLEAS